VLAFPCRLRNSTSVSAVTDPSRCKCNSALGSEWMKWFVGFVSAEFTEPHLSGFSRELTRSGVRIHP
jgi:hypothetical protein